MHTKPDENVNRLSPGDNGGPPSIPLTAKTKLECIKNILDREDLTSAQKCVGVGIIAHADREWTAEVKTRELQRFASADDRETVFRATKKLDAAGLIAKAHGKGQSGKYNVLPPRVIEAVIEAYEEKRTSRLKPDGGSGDKSAVKAVEISEQHVGLNPTAQAAKARNAPGARARGLDNKYNNYNNLLITPTTTVEQDAARGGWGHYDQEFPSLNGAAFDLLAFIQKHAPADETTARSMLRNNIQCFGADAMAEAFSVTLADLAERMIASPYKYLIGCARRAKNRGPDLTKAEREEQARKEKSQRIKDELRAKHPELYK